MDTDCRRIRHDILAASRASGHGHIPTSFSVVELLHAVYSLMRHDPVHPDWPERDIFVLSKGHAALCYYCVLAHFGYFSIEGVRTFGGFSSKYGCHPDRLKVPGVEVSTGSLGHGIGIAAGMALAFQLDGTTRRAYTVIGDGECNEGSVWEAVMVAADLRLSNLTVLLDFNCSQTRSLQIDRPAERFRAFGCDTREVDGHDVEAIKQAIDEPAQTVKAVVARTVKGYGCSTLTNNMFEWHRKSPNDDELARLRGELDEAP